MSATRAANLLGIITKMFATNGNPSILTISGKKYFFERGRENPDGAITGSLYQMLEGDKAKNVGRVRLGPEGFINAFPRMSCSYKREVEQMLHKMEETAPDLLREWAAAIKLHSQEMWEDYKKMGESKKNEVIKAEAPKTGRKPKPLSEVNLYDSVDLSEEDPQIEELLSRDRAKRQAEKK